MNLKLTAFLVVAAIAVGVVAWINPFKQEEAERDRSPWFYQVSEDDIETIRVRNSQNTVSFHKVSDFTWIFDEPEGIPPDPNRWGGVPLLLSGPGTKRDLTAVQPVIDDPTQYGLDDPDTIVDVGLSANRKLQFRLGDLTTDGGHHYGQVSGFPDLFLIAASWGEVISRLAIEPPLPKWYVKRDPESIAELNIYFGDVTLEDTRLLSFTQDLHTGEWTVLDYSTDIVDPIPVDPERWESIRPLITGPEDITVAVPRVEDRDYAAWGIVDDSKAIEIRFSGRTERGTTFTDGVLLRLGNKTEDGRYYYAKSETDYIRQPVINLDADWVETILALGDDVPYGEAPESQSSDSN